jgi:hypothetical protein
MTGRTGRTDRTSFFTGGAWKPFSRAAVAIQDFSPIFFLLFLLFIFFVFLEKTAFL